MSGNGGIWTHEAYAHDLKSRPVDQAWVHYHVSMTGFEPATFRLEVWRAIQLRHTDLWREILFLPSCLRQLVFSFGWFRTSDLPVNSRALCQLSYEGI